MRKKRFLLIMLFVGVLYWGYYFYWIKPGTSKLGKFRPPTCKEVSAPDQSKITGYRCPTEKLRIWTSLSNISPRLRELVVLLEDDRFFEHDGLDLGEIKNAIEADLEKGKLARGASTITQQLAKNLFLSKEKSFMRKASELPLILRLEQELSKTQILELYLNTIEWGPNLYGVEAASRQYFDKSASELTEYECWLLAIMIPNPKELFLWNKPKAKESLLKRARTLSLRLSQKREFNKVEALLKYSEFQKFLERWESVRPSPETIASRRYPLWTH